MRESEEVTEGSGHCGGSEVFGLGPRECEVPVGGSARMGEGEPSVVQA